MYKPKAKNRADQFKSLFNYWSQRLLKQKFIIKKDNRYNSAFLVDDFNVVKYNSFYVRSWDFPLLVLAVFHEMRHIIQGLVPYETLDEQLAAELDAEQYAVKMMKRYYPKDFKFVKRVMKAVINSKAFAKDSPVHHAAYSQIEEYQLGNKHRRKVGTQ